MNAIVLRNGASQGKQFVEVSADGVNYAVPVSQELPIGTEIEITVKVVEPPPPEQPIVAGTDVSTTTPPELEVPESPIAAGEAPDKDTAPSGQAEKKEKRK